MSARTSTNLEFRDNSGALIAFIDNGGNLKLKKTMNVNYAKALGSKTYNIFAFKGV